jgi:hypothetical protein
MPKTPSPLAPLPKGEGNPFSPLSQGERGWGCGLLPSPRGRGDGGEGNLPSPLVGAGLGLRVAPLHLWERG